MNKLITILAICCIAGCGIITCILSMPQDPIEKQPPNSEIQTDPISEDQSRIPQEETPQKDTTQQPQENELETKQRFDQRVLLPVEQRVQETAYYCVPATVQMVFSYHGISMTQSELADEMKAKPVTGTEYVDLAITLNQYLFHHASIDPSLPGYQIETLTGTEDVNQVLAKFEQRVKQDLSTNDPLFVAVDVQALYPNLSKGNHMVIVIGYETKEDSQDIASYYFLDPSYVVQDATYGGLKKARKEEFVTAILVNEEPAYLW